jgi:hypothetical protein
MVALSEVGHVSWHQGESPPEAGFARREAHNDKATGSAEACGGS